MSATLKDLAPAEKQKVARLIRQVVEKERQLKELEAAAAEWQQAQGNERVQEATAAAQPAEALCASKLAEQNQELARENTSLRAKLSHAFDLLRAYQHKCRVLEATVQVTGSVAGSRPTTPGWGWGDASLPQAGVHPQQLAARLDTFEGSLDGTPYRSGTSASAEAAAGAAASGQLSPVAEGAWEGASPDRPPAAAAFGQQQQRQWQQADVLQLHGYSQQAQHPPPTAAAGGTDASAGNVGAGGGGDAAPDRIQLVEPHSALPQLETLKMLAQALLEAQAEVAAKQQQQQPQQRPQWQHQHPQWQQQRCGAAETQASWPAGGAAASCAPAPSGGSLVFDASLGPHGGYLVGPPTGAAGSEGPGNCDREAAAAAAAGTAAAQPQARVPLAAVQQRAWGLERCGSSSSSCCSTAQEAPRAMAGQSGGSTHGLRYSATQARQFDGCLLDLVMDVEGMGVAKPGEGTAWRPKGGGESWGGGDDSGGSLAACGPQYEENDLLALISQL